MSEHSRDLSGRTVVVTGATRGLGRALVTAFAEAGAAVGVIARDEVALKELAVALPTDAVAVPCDIVDEAGLEEAFAEIAGLLGGVDSVVANAGIAPASNRAHKLGADVWRNVLEVNLTGTFLTARAAYPHLERSGRGRLVLTSSVMARAPRRGLSAYAASKAGIDGLGRALAADWASAGICVNIVSPGFFDAGLGTAFAESPRLGEQVLARTLLGRFGASSELVAATMFLAGDSSAYLTGHTMAVDGGYGLG